MHRFYLPPGDCGQRPLRLTGAEAHHASRVLRLQRGDPATILDGQGGEFRGAISDVRRDAVEVEIREEIRHSPPACRISLLQAVPKARLIELIIQKATELGAQRIVPLLTERTASHLDAISAEQKRVKWQGTAVEAIKQCGAPWLPLVEKPTGLKAWLGRNEFFELPLIASLQPGSRHAREYVDAFRARNGSLPRTACAWVGPEGDFTADEVEAVRRQGALPISLGPLVLRCDTAAVYCLSILNHELNAPR
jgi:16S rRNA (uracil1498-N3)-methyltransferase